MPFTQALAKQLANPHGRTGRWLGSVMDVLNRRPMQLAVDILAPSSGECVLDAGCGTGAAMAQILSRADCFVTGADRSETMLCAAQRKLGARANYVLTDLAASELPVASFDAILALNVLYFDEPDFPILRALYRLLRPGSRLVTYVTHRESMSGWSFTRAGYHRLYDPHDLHNAFIIAGFAPERITVHDMPVAGPVRGLFAKVLREG